jgi:hypothetical protein
MSRRMGMASALIAAALLTESVAASPIEPASKPKGKVTPTPRTKPKPQSESLRRMLRKAKQ